MSNKRNTLFILLYVAFALISCGEKGQRKNSPMVLSDSDSTAVSMLDSTSTRIGIKMTKKAGVYELPCLVNGVKMNFIFDTGASNVCLSTTEALFLYKNNYIDDTDFVGESYSRVADGSIVENMEIMLNSISLAGVEINNVKAVIVKSMDAPLLLGQSALQKFGKIEFSGDSLFITRRVPRANVDNIESSSEDKLYTGHRSLLGINKTKKIDDLLVKAFDAIEKDMPERAVQFCEEAITIDEKDWRSYALAGYSYDHILNQEGSAIYNYTIYRDLNKQQQDFMVGETRVFWGDMINRLAYDCSKQAKNHPSWTSLDDAITYAQEVLVRYPDNARAMYTISIAYSIKGDFERATVWARKLKSVDPKSGFFCLAYLYAKQGRTTEAINSYVKCLEIDPENFSAIGNLGRLYAKSFEEEEYWHGEKYYPPKKNKELYWETVRLFVKAARLGDDHAQNWLKKRNIDW